jgi:uncharacterized membrane protein
VTAEVDIQGDEELEQKQEQIQTALDYEEETEAVLKEFIKTELEIPDADQINFQNVHRLRKRNDGKP